MVRWWLCGNLCKFGEFGDGSQLYEVVGQRGCKVAGGARFFISCVVQVVAQRDCRLVGIVSCGGGGWTRGRVIQTRIVLRAARSSWQHVCDRAERREGGSC